MFFGVSLIYNKIIIVLVFVIFFKARNFIIKYIIDKDKNTNKKIISQKYRIEVEKSYHIKL